VFSLSTCLPFDFVGFTPPSFSFHFEPAWLLLSSSSLVFAFFSCQVEHIAEEEKKKQDLQRYYRLVCFAGSATAELRVS
jgi:hypothetical protein